MYTVRRDPGRSILRNVPSRPALARNGFGSFLRLAQSGASRTFGATSRMVPKGNPLLQLIAPERSRVLSSTFPPGAFSATPWRQLASVFRFLRYDVHIDGGRLAQKSVHGREIQVFPPVVNRRASENPLRDVFRAHEIRHRIRYAFCL